MAAEISHDRQSPFLADMIGKRGWRERHECLEVGHLLAERRISLPQPLPFPRLFVGQGEAAGAERQRPTVLTWQVGEALHRRSVNALAYDLV